MDGTLVWRTEIGESFNEPTISVDRVIVTTHSGKIIGLNSATGDTYASVQLPQRTTVSAAVSERYPFIYQPGEYANLYVLDLESLNCREVVYLGYAEGSVSVPPIDWSGYIVLPVNGPDYCSLNVLKPSKEEGVTPGLGLYRTQVIPRVTEGHVTTPLYRMSRKYLAVSDTGNLKLLEMNYVDDEDSPINILSEHKIDVRSGDRNYVYAEGSRLWIAGKGIEQYKVTAVGEFKSEPIQNQGDFFLGPVGKLDNFLIHVRRRARSAMASVSAVDSQTMGEVWRTDVGAAFAGTPKLTDTGVQVVNSCGDLFNVDQSAESVGYIDRAVWSADVAENFLFTDSVPMASGGYVCIGPESRRDYLQVNADGTTKLGRLQSPADRPACDVIGFRDSLIVASKTGHVVVVDPKTGRRRCDPFQPPKRPDVDTIWRTPAVVSDTGIVTGLANGTVYLLDCDEQSISKNGELNIDGALTSGFVAANKVAYAAAQTDEGPHIIAWQTDGEFAEAKRLKLSANVVAGLWIAGNSIFVATDEGQLVAYTLSLDEEPKWSIALDNDAIVSKPMVVGASILVSLASGKLVVVDGDSGDIQNEIEVGQAIAQEPVFSDDKVYIGSSDGRLLVLPRSAF